MYLSAFVVGRSTWGAISSVRPLLFCLFGNELKSLWSADKPSKITLQQLLWLASKPLGMIRRRVIPHNANCRVGIIINLEATTVQQHENRSTTVDTPPGPVQTITIKLHNVRRRSPPTTPDGRSCVHTLTTPAIKAARWPANDWLALSCNRLPVRRDLAGLSMFASKVSDDKRPAVSYSFTEIDFTV